MKSTSYLIVVLFAVCFSCQTNDDKALYESSIEKNENVTTRGLDEPTEEATLENELEWVAYLAAQAIITDSNAKAQFQTALANSGNLSVVKLEDLIGDTVVNASFMNAFEERFNFFETITNCMNCPGGRNHPDENSNCSNFCMFLEVILDDNCLEFYLPNGISPLSLSFSSTGHPMNTDLFNDAYVHNGIFVTRQTVKNTNVSTFNNLLVVRPYIDSVNYCDYSEYSGIDFTLYLD